MVLQCDSTDSLIVTHLQELPNVQEFELVLGEDSTLISRTQQLKNFGNESPKILLNYSTVELNR